MEISSKYKDSIEKKVVKTPSTMYEESSEFFRKWAEWAYSFYCGGYSLISASGHVRHGRTVKELRDYARGHQDPEKYRSVVDKKVTVKGRDAYLTNISNDNTRLYSTIRAKVVDRILERTHQPQVMAIDTASRYEREKQYWRDKFAADPRARQMFANVGMTPSGVSEETMIMESSDIDTLKELGGYRFGVEILLRDAIVASMALSDYHESVRRPCVEDIVDLGVHAVHVHSGHDRRQLVKYLDPARVVCRASAKKDHSDIDFAGYVESKTIAQVRMESGISDEKVLRGIVNTYISDPINKGFNQVNGLVEDYSNLRNYDDMHCETITVYFVAGEAERYVTGNHSRGGYVFDKVDLDSSLNKSAQKKGKQIADFCTQNVYKVTWVVGTNIVYNTGKDDTIIREGADGNKRACLPILIYSTNEASITERVIPVIDDIEIAVRKKRLALAKMPPPPGLAIDHSLIGESVTIGGQSFNQADVLDIYSITGALHYESKSEWGLDGEGSNRPPISPVSNASILEHITIARQEIVSGIQLMQQMAGLNDVTDATGSPQDVLNKVADHYDAATNRSLTMCYAADAVMLNRIAKTIGRRYQSAVAFGQIKLDYIPVMSGSPSLILLTPDIQFHDFDFSIKRAPGPESVQMILQSLTAHRQQSTLGEDAIFNVTNMVLNGDIEKAQFFLAKYVAAKRKADMQAQQSAMQVQAQEQAKTAAMIEEANRKTKAMEAETKGVLAQQQIDAKAAEGDKSRAHDVRMATLNESLTRI